MLRGSSYRLLEFFLWWWWCLESLLSLSRFSEYFPFFYFRLLPFYLSVLSETSSSFFSMITSREGEVYAFWRIVTSKTAFSLSIMCRAASSLAYFPSAGAPSKGVFYFYRGLTSCSGLFCALGMLALSVWLTLTDYTCSSADSSSSSIRLIRFIVPVLVDWTGWFEVVVL